MSSKRSVTRMVLSAMFLALALILPLLTGQIPEIGSALCPMHLPVLLCGYFCGPWYALAIGLIAPPLRFVIFGMPPMMPTGLAMCFELMTYGFIAGLLYRLFPKKTFFLFLSLICSMIAGRLVWGAVRVILAGVGSSAFGWSAFLAGAVGNAIPGIIAQIVLVPLIVARLGKLKK